MSVESKYFKETVFSFGGKNSSEVIKFEFEFKDGIDPEEVIHYIWTGCPGCTTVKLKGSKLVGEMILAKAQSYQKGLNPVNKYIQVYINDGECTYIGDENKSRRANPNKTIERLQLAGVVSH